MIQFQKILPSQLAEYAPYLHTEEKCEYSFVNLCIWGKQQAAIVDGQLAFFSLFNRRAVYLFPAGDGDKKAVLDAILHDAQMRGIRCCITGMSREKCEILQQLYPGKFHFFLDRDGFDYIYDINDLADLKGRRFQKKRNHLNKFRFLFPHWRTEPISDANLQAVRDFATQWYETRRETDPQGDYHLEQQALTRALNNLSALKLEGIVLLDGQRILAFTLASALTDEIYDVHFEKALDDIDGAYAAINQAFAAYLREMHPHLLFLNREDDMGIEGLRQAKQSYQPHHMAEKYWAVLGEDDDV